LNILFAAEYYYANPPLMNISRELARRKHNISVVTSLRQFDKRTSHNVKIFEVKPLVTIFAIPRVVTFPMIQLSHIFAQQQIEIIHSPNDHSTNVAAAGLIARALNRPFVYTIQGTGTKTGHFLVDAVASMYSWTVGKWHIREASKIVLLSKGLIPTAQKSGIEKKKIVIIPSGVDNARFDPDRPDVEEKTLVLRNKLKINDEVVIGYTGRLYPAKGLTYLLQAAKKIADKNRKIALLLVGDGAQMQELEHMAKALKIKAMFVGWQHDLEPYYQLMDIFVLPSLFEGLPNVILEAMAMKKPIIATNVGGNPDVVSNGENGFLVPVCDAELLADALEKLVDDYALRVKMGAVNRQKIEHHFLWSQTADKIEKVYREILGQRSKSRTD
jgi:glycosyltransferase involved in cell wall biosynthesis